MGNSCSSQPEVRGDGLAAPTKLGSAVPKRGSMVSTWHSAIEGTKQSLGERQMPRSTILAKQVGARADDLARVRADLGHAHQQITSFLTSVGKGIESTESDSAYARRLHPELQANMVDCPAALAEVNSTLNARLTRDVYTPILAWQARETQMIRQYKACEKARLELDHRRRAVAKLEENVARIAAGGKQEAQLQQQIAKRDAMESAYVAQEEDMVRALESLMIDPVMVQRLSALGMDAFADALSRVAASLHIGLPPAPVVPLPSSEGVGIMSGPGSANYSNAGTPTHGRMATPTHSGRNTPTYAGTPTRAGMMESQSPFTTTKKPTNLEMNDHVSSSTMSGSQIASPGTPVHEGNGINYNKYDRQIAA